MPADLKPVHDVLRVGRESGSLRPAANTQAYFSNPTPDPELAAGE